MRAALELLRDLDPPGRRIVVSGDMAELGEQAGALHLANWGTRWSRSPGADLLFACGSTRATWWAAARAAGIGARPLDPLRSVDEALPYLGQRSCPATRCW